MNIKLEYELTKDDYIEFNLFYLKTSPTIAKTLKLQKVVPPIFFMAAAVGLWVSTGWSLITMLLVFGLLSIGWVYYYPRYFVSVTKKRVSMIVDEGKSKFMPLKVTLEIKKGEIIQRSESGETRAYLNSLESVQESENLVLIFVNTLLAYIIPKKQFANESEKTELIDFLNRAISGEKDEEPEQLIGE
ncbi:MAG: YcxB family protein [Clostridiales bacterium]|nr:YcxB family protein [Clostridiales bacterium]